MYKDKSSVNESCSSTSSDNSTKTVLITSPIPGPSTSSFQQNIVNATDTISSTTTTTTSSGATATATTTATTATNKTIKNNSSTSILDSNNSINLLSSSTDNLSFNLNQSFRRSSHPVFSFQSEDINLLTDIGYIATQLNYLEHKFSYFNNILGPYDYHKEIEKFVISIQKKYNKYNKQDQLQQQLQQQQQQQQQLQQQQQSKNNIEKTNQNDQIECITKSENLDNNLSSSIQQNLDENNQIKIDQNSLEIESLGPISNLIKQTELTQLQIDTIKNINQLNKQSLKNLIATTIVDTSDTTTTTFTTTTTTTYQTNEEEYSKIKRTDILEDLLIKFYKCQEERIKIQEQIDYQKEIDKRFPKNLYIMSCGSIEKLLSLDDQKNLNNINYNNNNRKQSNPNTNNIPTTTITTTTTTGDNSLLSSIETISTSTSTAIATIPNLKYYAGSKLFGISAIPSSSQSQQSQSISSSPSNNITTINTTGTSIVNNINNSNKLIPSPQQNISKQCSKSNNSINSSIDTTATTTTTPTATAATTITTQSPAAITNRTIGIIKQQSTLPSTKITNPNRRSSSSVVENRTNSNIHDLKTELLNNSRKFSVGALSSDLYGGSNASSINTELTSSQSSFKSAASNAFLKNDNNFLTTTTATSTNGKGSAIILSRSSGNVHFKDDEKSSSINNLLLQNNDIKSTTIFKSTSDIISHCKNDCNNDSGSGSSSSYIKQNNDGINIIGSGGSIKNINSNSSICLIERKNSNERTTATATTTTTTILVGSSDNNSDYNNQNNNNYSNNNNNNNNSNNHNNNNNNCNLNNINNNNNSNCNNDVRKDSSGSSGSKGSEFNLIQLQNTIIQCQFNNDDLRTVVGDLKRKIDYTEKMNWLCLSKRPIGPPHRKTSLTKHSEVKKRFLEICDKTLSDDIKSALRLPAFDSYDWEDADVIYLMQTMFVELGLIDKFNIPIETLREWLYEVYKHYNEVPFHNFRHCFCVAQMMYAMSQQANLCQRLGELEVLILLVSCICHDLDHPGYNNIYQINARTELALRYNDISPLENHHCSIAFRLLEHPDCNIFKNFNRETFNFIREGIIRCILATDMARHNEILTQFKDVISTFDYSNRSHINLLCMVLIKVADISNEARPMEVAEPWLDRLLTEFFAQSAAEKSEGLPVTPFMDPDKVSKPGSQVRFIGLVLLPLFEALGELIPEIIELIIIPVRIALDYYKCLNDAQNKQRKSVAESNTENSSDTNGSCSPQIPRSQSGISVKSRRSIPSQKSTSRTSVDEPTCINAELHDLPEGSESGDSETATEVDVAEKTSKFKVDTESGNRSKASHSTCHRKSNREKRPSMISEMCSSGGRMRNSYGNIHGHHSNRGHFGSNRAVSLDQYNCNNRRSSDGLQQVISDSYVFYNRQNEGGGLQSQQNSSGSTSTPASDKPKHEQHGGVVIGEDVVNMNSSQMYCDQLMLRQMSLQCHSANAQATFMAQHQHLQNLQQQQLQQQQQEQNQKNEKDNSKLLSGANKESNGDYQNQQQSSSNYNQKSWRARFKQITDIFSIFDKSGKRINNSKNSSDSTRNNNTTTSSKDVSKQGLCCTISNNYFPTNSKQKQLKHQQSQYISHQTEITNITGRNRAYSLDVPCSTYRQQRYSSSSGGESRKSSRNEDNSNRQDVFTEDNNSYNTSSGDAPPIRISGGDGSDGTIPISTQPLPRVITPTFKDNLNDSTIIYTTANEQQQQINGGGGGSGEYNSGYGGPDSGDNYSSNQSKI